MHQRKMYLQCLNKFYLHAILTLIGNRDRLSEQWCRDRTERERTKQSTKPSGYNWISMKKEAQEWMERAHSHKLHQMVEELWRRRVPLVNHYFIGSINGRYFIHITYLSDVDFTSSCFHKPQVSCRAVDKNNKMLMTSRTPTGPKKYAKIARSSMWSE